MLLSSQGLIPHVKRLLSQDTKDVTLVSAFLKVAVLEELIPFLKNHRVKVYARWTLMDLVSGVSDLEVYPLCKKHGIPFYINHRIHAKLMVVEGEGVVLGSSNYTLSGTGRGKKNIEWNTFISDPDYQEILRSISLSKRLSDDLFSEIEKQVQEQQQLAEAIEKLPIKPYKLNAGGIELAEPRPHYGSWDLELLPPFSPSTLDVQNDIHCEFLVDKEVYDFDDLTNFYDWLRNIPLTKLIWSAFRQHNNTEVLRWGQISDLILEDQISFSRYDNEEDLKECLDEKQRLRNYMHWLSLAYPQLIFWTRDPINQGTCSINLDRTFKE